MPNSIQLVYCYDPMCSWCWGFQSCWTRLQTELAPILENGELSIRPMLGGLAPDSEEPMPSEMRAFLESTWQRIESQLGTRFNYDFWRNCKPRRSTYPACRACLAARDCGLETEMTEAIEHAYYLEAKNPSDVVTLVDCAEKIGIEQANFIAAMKEIKSSGRLEQEISEARQLGLNSFPSFAVVSGDRIIHINIDYQNPQAMAAEIKHAITKLS